jgi:hypothetical protein
MRLSRLPCAALAAAVALAAAPAARAGDLDKLLPDDAAFVVAVNAKQIHDWPQFKKQVQGEIEKALKMDFAQNVLKDTGFDPLRDLDRVILSASAADAAAAATGPSDTFFAVLQGKFDADKLKSRADQLAKDTPAVFKVRKAGDAPLLEIAAPGAPFFLVLVDKNTLVVTNVEAKATEAVDKAAGKKKTELKSKRLADFLAKGDPKVAAEWFAGGEMTASTSVSADANGKVTVKHTTLKDAGVEGFRGAATLGDSDVKFQTSVYAKDAAGAKELTKKIKDGLDQAIADGTKESEKRPELKPILEAMKNVKVGTADDAVTLEGGAPADVIVAFVKSMGVVQPPPPKPDR